MNSASLEPAIGFLNEKGKLQSNYVFVAINILIMYGICLGYKQDREEGVVGIPYNFGQLLE